MTSIIVIQDERETDELTFAADADRIRIGRRPANDVCIADRSVSGNHALLTLDSDGLWIEDLGSTNGTYVNGEAVKRHRLNTGDTILVGKVRLQIDLPARHVATRAAPVDSMDASAMDDSFEEMQIAPVDDDDELDESMRAALALYSDDPEPESVTAAPVLDEDDDIDFSEDARLFAQSAQDAQPQSASASGSADLDDDRLPDSQDAADGEEPLKLTERAKVALGRDAGQQAQSHAVNGGQIAPEAAESEQPAARVRKGRPEGHSESGSNEASRPLATNGDNIGPTHNLEPSRSQGAVIEIKNGAKSGQILPIDKPVTTLGRPGIQIAAIMRKPDGYFLMHIESDDSVDRPTLNADSIGDEPVLLHSGDELNVAGIDVEFMLA